MISSEVVDLLCLQFGIMVFYYFLFVLLMFGLFWLFVIMEVVYVMIGKQVYKDMIQFWGKLFGINFVMGVMIGIMFEFQFGMNWLYYLYYVGDIFGVLFVVEGLMVFFFELMFVGLFFFGWNCLLKVKYLVVMFFVVLGLNLFVLWIFVVNGWMNNLVGVEFNYQMMCMELMSLFDVLFNLVVQVKFVYIVLVGYVMVVMFVFGILLWYLLKKCDVDFVLCLFVVVVGFGFVVMLCVIVFGDELGYMIGEVQKMKFVVIELEWEIQLVLVLFMLIGILNQKEECIDYVIKILYVFGLIVMCLIDELVIGLCEFVKYSEEYIQSGMVVYGVLQKIKEGDMSDVICVLFDQYKQYFGYGLMFKQFMLNVVDVMFEQIKVVVKKMILLVVFVFFLFWIMVFFGFLFFVIFVVVFWFCVCWQLLQDNCCWFLCYVVWVILLLWFVVEFGWVVVEFGCQLWMIVGILLMYLFVFSLMLMDLYLSFVGFIVFYMVLFIIEIKLMFKYVCFGLLLLYIGCYYYEFVVVGEWVVV